MIVCSTWLILAIASRIIEKTWWAPASIFSLVFSLSAVGTVIFAPEYYISPTANLSLQGFAIAILGGGVVGRLVGGNDHDSFTADRAPVVKRRIPFLAFGFVAAGASLLSTMQSLKITAADLLSFGTLQVQIQEATAIRYTDGLGFSPIYSIANAAVLSYTVLFVVDSVAQRRWSLLSAVPIIIYVVSNVLITTRAPVLMLLVIIVFSSSYAVYLRDGVFPSFSAKGALACVITVALVIAMFYYLQVLRFGPESTRSSSEVWSHLRRWPWGSLPGYSAWYTGIAQRTEIRTVPGFYTFMGIYDNLGIADRIVGGYREYVYLTSEEPGNIYTAFRGLIVDFGYVGALALCGLLGTACRACMTGFRTRPLLGLSCYVGTAGFLAYAFVVSFWAYASVIIGLLAVPLLGKCFMGRSVSTESSAIQETTQELV